MENELRQLADEAIQLELNIAKLYMIFQDVCPHDVEFWWDMVIEEQNHAALLRSGVEFFMQAGLFPDEILPVSIADIQQANEKLISLIEKYDQKPPSRKEAFMIALQTELSTGEIHYQHLMTKATESRVVKLFQKLNEEDKDHAQRIQTYMKNNGLDKTAGDTL